jgi:hypothetical protein
LLAYDAQVYAYQNVQTFKFVIQLNRTERLKLPAILYNSNSFAVIFLVRALMNVNAKKINPKLTFESEYVL